MFFELKKSDVNELFKSRKGHSPPRIDPLFQCPIGGFEPILNQILVVFQELNVNFTLPTTQ